MNRALLFPTDLGWIAVALKPEVGRQGHLVIRTAFGFPSSSAAELSIENSRCKIDDPENDWEVQLIERFQDFATGHQLGFSDIRIDETWMTPFQKRVIKHCRKIKYGKTLAYGELATKSGSPNAARAVGSVMANNRFPLIVPCHRVIASGGRIGGFSSIDGISMKQRLLAMESGELQELQETKNGMFV